jgi:cytochrome c oxidase subunit 4
MTSKSATLALPSLLIIYAALIALLLATVFANTLNLGLFALLVALLIAIAKALLVIYFFMHLRIASKATWLFVAAGFLWLSMLFTMTFADYLTRSWSERAEDIAPTASHTPPPPGYTPAAPNLAPPLNFQPSPHQK